MSVRIRAFFQHMPPYSGAAALRGLSVISALASLERLRHADIRVFTTTPSPNGIPGATVTPLPVREVENSERLVPRFFGELRMGWVAARAMFAPDGCELAIVSSPGYIAALVATAWARWRGVPYVVELRDVYPQVYAEAGLLRRDSLPYRFLADCSRRMYLGARLVIVATRGLGRAVSEAAPDARVACVYNGFPGALRERSATKHGRFTVCFHGTLGFFQDIETLVRIASRVAEHDIDVVVIGYGRKEEPLRNAGLPNLRFLGRRPFEETIAEVERCHVGLCLRLDDGISKDAFPVKVWEYLGLGIPSIVTPPCEAGAFLVEHGCGLQFAAGDIDGIVAALLAWKRDGGALRRLADRCREVSAQYTREQMGVVAAQHVERLLDGMGQ